MRRTTEILDLRRLSERSCLSVRTFREACRRKQAAHYRLDGKILVAWEDFLVWLEAYRVDVDLEAIMDQGISKAREDS